MGYTIPSHPHGRYILICWLTENSSAKFPLSGQKKPASVELPNRCRAVLFALLGRLETKTKGEARTVEKAESIAVIPIPASDSAGMSLARTLEV